MQVGSGDDDSAITEMIPLRDTLYIVKQRGIYAVQLADQIDPDRANAAIPNTQQRILPVGSSDAIVARTLLTAQKLFKKGFLGHSFDQDQGLTLALDILKDLVALTEMRTSLEEAESQARVSFESQSQDRGTLVVPSIGDIGVRWDGFTQKAGHVVNSLEEMAKLFYGKELANKWVDSLAAVTASRYGNDSPFAEYVRAAKPRLLLVLDLRNMVEHPKPNKYIRVNDFRLQASGRIALPSVEIVRPDQEAATATINLLMKLLTDELLSITEVLMAHLCSHHVQLFGGIPMQVFELPPEQRQNQHLRFSYGWHDSERIIPAG